MTSLVAVGTHVPEGRVPVEALAERFELTPMQVRVFRRYHKIGQAAHAPESSLTDLLRAALADLALTGEQAARVRYVLYARTFPVVVPYPHNPLHDVCRDAGLGHAQAFAVGQQACASGLLAIDLAGRLLADDPSSLAVVLTGEKAFTGEAQFVPETSMFGEGAAACLVSASGERDRLLSYVARLRGEFDGDLEEVAGEFQRIYHDALGEAVTAAVAKVGLELADIAVILPHNVNVVAWQRTCKRIGYPLDRVLLEHVADYGHVFCADAFVNHRTAVARGLLRPGDRYVVAAAGAGRGATFAAMVFEH
ncbi:3-oxoacyl-[acyl-carrier-protein] synthase III C-terminal domain-containing protein [Dactylosporangium sp. AC04546]|uniref:3-oxoacyl-[acyl-carrier-protein] synthase III C-terminal domain-containing protein n=1 Tax=Dactylosporangium sp. AC04546 TaxID=2862460 RepID=UPI001EDEFD0A|nr:3-oxoacyl-[acyl-carrier-protein] synthase III C-terminal domain-containing protein [Dactylosporangium sp. AC04546]WVK86187.1 3-oxoacyl-[acyl-carrier-protein] synthase III C-terminal domain-containing protein [Dactylosporangium sp. AC04546]